MNAIKKARQFMEADSLPDSAKTLARLERPLDLMPRLNVPNP